ncbi:MAG: M13 family metallopeptidase [candidate division Zixibacteria bacterium]|nr:M13 family metallopeptidase [candidate division Zixibacteria bacterium]
MRNTLYYPGFLLTIIALMISSQTSAQNQQSILPGIDYTIIDTTINPIDDFYRFANQKWLDTAHIPEGFGRYGYFDIMSEKIDRDILAMIDDRQSSREKTNTRTAITNLYLSGMDSTLLEKGDFKLLADIIARIDSIQTKSELAPVLAQLQLWHINPFFQMHEPKSPEMKGIQYFYLKQCWLTLGSKSDYDFGGDDGEEKRAIYKKYISDILISTGHAPETINEDAEKIIAIEERLSAIQMDPENVNDPDKTYNEYTAIKLKQLVFRFDWAGYFSELGIADTGKIIIGQPGYFRRTGNIIRDLDLESIKLYIKWRVLYKCGPYLNGAQFLAFMDFKQKTAHWISIPRDVFIFDAVKHTFSKALNRMYIDNYFPPLKIAKVVKMIGNLKQAFSNRIKNSTWMSDDFKLWALEKLDAIKVKLGESPDFTAYNDLTLDPGQPFIRNLFTVREYKWKNHFLKFGQPIKPQDWKVASYSTNAWYYHNDNTVILPAGSVNELYSETDDAWNYGTLGRRIGHEMTHGFDDNGIHYDKDGQRRSWWFEIKNWFSSDSKQFKTRAEQLVEQFNHYTVLKNHSVNGESTLSENIADLGGLNIAFDAFQISQEGKKPDTINGYSPNQRFFLSNAQMWRELFIDQILINSANGYHAPPEFRTNGIVYNIPGFYDAFATDSLTVNVKTDSTRITIW